MNIQNRPIPSIQQVQSELLTKKPQASNTASTDSFSSILQQKLQSQDLIKFSKHANIRLSQREISLSDEQMVKLQQGIQKAEQKGIKESLVLMDQIALVVNVENKTVITALNQDEAKEHVFTNIDGAVIV